MPSVPKAFAVLSLGAASMLPPSAHAELSWIWSPQADADRVSLRREVTLPDQFSRATLIVTCDNKARVYVNDTAALVSSDWNEGVRANVTVLLKPGSNWIRAEAENEGGPAGFIARLSYREAGGKTVVVESDGSWQARAQGDADWKPAKIIGRYGDDPWGNALASAGVQGGSRTAEPPPSVIQPSDIGVLPGFRVELLHTVPKPEQGSWVSMTVDPEGRIIACDQYGGLYRMKPSPVGSGQAAPVEKLESKAGGAHGLLYAFNSLYVMVNEQGGRQGLWRLRDTDGDGQFDEERQLRKIEGGGEHGPHAIVLSPDGESLHIVCGNHTKLPEGMEYSRIPRHWDEDQIVPRMWDANGHARGILAPGGYICRTDPDGGAFDLVSHGYRNAYDIAFNALGDIITYDSDMEWDAGSPWYRPTRICLATSGSEFGWRSGSGKWPSYYPDSLPALVDIGPGSPTGVESGRGAKFPARYQHAIYANDWTYGTMYAIHLQPDGGGYRAEKEEFVTGKPLPLTDLVVNPRDGALYFAIGGRRTQSAVYRLSYVGNEPTAAAAPPKRTPEMLLRQELEQLHQRGTGVDAVAKAWPHLAHPDRWVRYAARIAVERQPVSAWGARAVQERRAWAVIELGVALARAGKDAEPLRDAMLAQLNRLEFASLDEDARLAAVRAYQLMVIRQGIPEGTVRSQVIARLDAEFPSRSFDLNKELAATLIALEAPTAVAKTLSLMSTARDEDIRYASDALLGRNSGYANAFNIAANTRPNQQQIAYAYLLRAAKTGWNPALRRTFFAWFPRTAPWQGGNSFRGFLENIRKESLALVPDADERAALDTLSSKKIGVVAEDFPPPTGPGQDYTVDTILGLAENGLKGRDFQNGRSLFHSAACFSCHLFAGTGGGVGPDLTGSASRYSLRDLLENIVDPSKVISDQYGSEQIELTDGSSLIGRAYEENGKIHVVYDPRNPDEKESADLSKVKARRPYPVSLMPNGLLNSMNPDEVLNLLAYIQSAGNPDHPAFKK
ncbi:MAG: c-type cytochrome [Limisphaerales bacterium]